MFNAISRGLSFRSSSPKPEEKKKWPNRTGSLHPYSKTPSPARPMARRKSSLPPESTRQSSPSSNIVDPSAAAEVSPSTTQSSSCTLAPSSGSPPGVVIQTLSPAPPRPSLTLAHAEPVLSLPSTSTEDLLSSSCLTDAGGQSVTKRPSTPVPPPKDENLQCNVYLFIDEQRWYSQMYLKRTKLPECGISSMISEALQIVQKEASKFVGSGAECKVFTSDWSQGMKEVFRTSSSPASTNLLGAVDPNSNRQPILCVFLCSRDLKQTFQDAFFSYTTLVKSNIPRETRRKRIVDNEIRYRTLMLFPDAGNISLSNVAGIPGAGYQKLGWNLVDSSCLVFQQAMTNARTVPFSGTGDPKEFADAILKHVKEYVEMGKHSPISV